MILLGLCNKNYVKSIANVRSNRKTRNSLSTKNISWIHETWNKTSDFTKISTLRRSKKICLLFPSIPFEKLMYVKLKVNLEKVSQFISYSEITRNQLEISWMFLSSQKLSRINKIKLFESSKLKWQSLLKLISRKN